MELGSRGVKTEEATINNNDNNGATSSSSGGSNMNPSTNKNQALAQYSADARLLTEYEQSVGSGKSFNYSTLLTHAPKAVAEQEMTAYLSKIQRGGFVQPFGCMIAVHEPTFRIISFSENCFSMLSLNVDKDQEKDNLDGLNEAKKSLLGVDARTLFTSSSRASLERAVASREISLLNPIWVHSRTTRKPFYAILHRIDVGVVIDLEPANSSDPTFLLAGAVQSQKLVVRAISRLQSLPGGDIGAMCDTVVEEVQKLTGYDRVMVYKFHDDEHGEVVSEIRRSDLEPYLGLHYPATDIPQAARFLFKQNRVRIIVDCHADSVPVIQSQELKQPLCLVNSTLRAPHGCHAVYMANMGSIASLVMAILINNNDSMKLWGLLYMELQLAEQKAEKKILRMQTTLCDMLLRDDPFRIITQSPSIMDLVKCDGAALYYDEKVWLLGVTPTESQVIDIANWLCSEHKNSTGFSTESLLSAGYPDALSLGDAVCGMAAARITSKDFLFWFRSNTKKEIKWAGAKHHPQDEDNGERMHPRSSFKAFLEVVKSRSFPWEVSEINVIHSLQLIMRTSAQDDEDNGGGKMMKYGQQTENGAKEMKEISSVACEMVRLIETASVPIFGVDASGLINGWNGKIAELTGVIASEAMGKSLIDEVVHETSRVIVKDLVYRALQGEEKKNVELKLQKVGVDQKSNTILYIVANTCTSRDYMSNVIGVCFVGQDVTTEKIVMDKFIRMEGDYNTIVQSLNPLIPPLFASDENACCSEWNAAMETLTGHMKHEVLEKVLPGDVFGGLCRLKDEDTLTKFMIFLYRAINGHDASDLPFGFFGKDGNLVEVHLTANKRVGEGGKVVGCFCFLQTSEQWSLNDRKRDGATLKRNDLAFVRQEIKNPLNGLRFTHKLLENSAISDDQKQYLETSGACERQIASIIENMDVKSIEDGNVELNLDHFVMENLLDAIVSQVMIMLKEKNIPLVHEIPDQVKTLALVGDQIRLQIVLSDFLLSVVNHAPSPDGWVEIKVSPGLRMIQDGHEFIHLQFRYGLWLCLLEKTNDALDGR
ncbi:GAF domain-containing protein [Artemisia annua]|uniref:GAF domain-containing protein n=1 Tax=Artemisia annua TaxID=35608 RepID=A0A2U1PP68_ARTAN|nr:GAF domain-containing protein [Artemisia annua]